MKQKKKLFSFLVEEISGSYRAGPFLNLRVKYGPDLIGPAHFLTDGLEIADLAHFHNSSTKLRTLISYQIDY